MCLPLWPQKTNKQTKSCKFCIRVCSYYSMHGLALNQATNGWSLGPLQEHLQQNSVCDPVKIFFTSKFSYVLFCNPAHKTETGTTNRWGTTNSKTTWTIFLSQPACVGCSWSNFTVQDHIPSTFGDALRGYVRWRTIHWVLCTIMRHYDGPRRGFICWLSGWVLFVLPLWVVFLPLHKWICSFVPFN